MAEIELQDADSNYDYGWSIFTTPRNARLIAHNGGNGIFAADFLRYLDEDVVIIGLSNTAGKPVWKVTSQVARMVFGDDYFDPFAEQKMEEETATNFPSDDDLAQLAQKWNLSNSAMGRRSAALLETISRKDEKYTQSFIQSHFAPGFLNAFPMQVHLKQFKNMDEDFSEFELTGATTTSANAARLKCRPKQTGIVFTLELDLEPQEPYRIKGLNVQLGD